MSVNEQLGAIEAIGTTRNPMKTAAESRSGERRS
jgi:hypothetical protein